MRKLLCVLSMLLLCVSGVFALSVTSLSPVNGSFVKGTASDLFSASSDAGTGAVYVDGIGTIMSCAGGVCSANLDMHLVADNSVHSFFWILNSSFVPAFPLMYSFRVSRDPAMVQNVVASSVSESEISVSFDAVAEADITNYNVYRNGSLISSPVTNSFLDGGLSIGDSWCYEVSAIDSDGNEGVRSAVDCALVTDLTPPSAPVISGNVANSTPIVTSLVYSEPVSLKVGFGSVVVADLGVGSGFVFTTVPPLFGIRNYEAVACDSYNNCVTTPFSVTYQAPSVLFNATVVDVPFWNEPTYRIIKNTGVASGSDFWTMEVNVSFYGYNNIRPFMSDVVGVNTGSVMRVDEDIVPELHCLADLSDASLYNLDNVVDLGQGSVDSACADQDASLATRMTFYQKIPIKVGSPTDDYSWTEGWDGVLI